MRILLATPYIVGEGDTGKLWAKALLELGHSLILWDFRLNREPPSYDYDLCIVIKGDTISEDVLRKLKSPKIYYFNDDPNVNQQVQILRRVSKYFDKVYTLNKIEGYSWLESEWLPLGYDPDIHRDWNFTRSCKVLYMGTNNCKKKEKYCRYIKPVIFGNGWQGVLINSYAPQYFLYYSKTLSQAQVALNILATETGPNRKFFEIPNSAFMLTTWFNSITEFYDDELIEKTTFTNEKQGKELCDYYVENEDERLRLWKKQKEAIKPYTYKNQIKKILEGLD